LTHGNLSFLNLKIKKLKKSQVDTWQNPNLTCVSCFFRKKVKKLNKKILKKLNKKNHELTRGTP